MTGQHEASRTPNVVISDPRVRKALYAVAVAVGAILVALGVVTQDEVNVWLELIGNLFLAATGLLALVNTPRKPTP